MDFRLNHTSIATNPQSQPQIVLKPELVESIKNSPNPEWQARIAAHHAKHPTDPLPIPFNDPEPQVMVPYTSEFPWHCQIHRDAFSYGDVGPRADPRVVVDLRFFGRQEIRRENRVYFGSQVSPREWVAGNTDIYGMPQATVSDPKCAPPCFGG